MKISKTDFLKIYTLKTHGWEVLGIARKVGRNGVGIYLILSKCDKFEKNPILNDGIKKLNGKTCIF